MLEHLPYEDVAALRLTARAFRNHPAVLRLCGSAGNPPELARHHIQAGLSFLERLPELDHLTLDAVKSLHGFQSLTQITELTVQGCPSVLDFEPLAQLPNLTCMCLHECLHGCPAERVGNLSVLTQLTMLRVSQGSLHPEVSALTALQSLQIYAIEDHSVPAGFNAGVYSSLTGLTSLMDHGLSHQSWAGLPLLRYLHVIGQPPPLTSIAALTGLRGLVLNLGEAEGSSLTSLAPLSSLTCLQRLGLIERALPIPALPSLIRLSLDYTWAGGTFPDMDPSPSLRVLEVLCYGELHLPDLTALFPRLRVLLYDDREGRLTMNVRDRACKFKMQCITQSHAIDGP